MIKTVNVTKFSEVRVVDTFRPAVMNANGGTPEVDIHFGSNMDILVIVASKKQLSRDNQERIRILTDIKS
jgi:hypothetical protein